MWREGANCVKLGGVKTIFIALLTVLLGAALGVGSAMLKIKARPWNWRGDEGTVAAGAVVPPGGLAPKVSIDQAEYQFGTLDKEATGRHDFVFHNTGHAPLGLSAGATSCRCIRSDIRGIRPPPVAQLKLP